jgi:flagellin-like hook-associated protein FlgL
VPITLGSNIVSLNAQRQLGRANDGLSTAFERLSSGLRINRASDDAAGLAIAQDLNTKSRIYTRGILNGNDGQSLLSIADATIGQLTEIVTRIRELSTQAANGALSFSQRKSIDAEAQTLSKEYFRVSRSARFNGINIFDGTISDGVRLQLGVGTEESLQSSLGGVMGTGTLTAGATYASESSGSNGIVTGDLNNDGILDLVTGGNASGVGYATVRLGVGDGTFGSATSYLANDTGTSDVALGDLNGDGILDLIAAGSSASGGQLVVRLGNGNGTFGASASYDSGLVSNNNVKTADVNSDGILDLISTVSTNRQVNVRFGNGNGTFASFTSYQYTGNALDEVALGDLNNDGILDMVTINYSRSGLIKIRIGDGRGGFGTDYSYNAGLTEGTGGIVLGDINGDSILDLVAGGWGSGSAGYTATALGLGDGTFGTAITYTSEISRSDDIALADLNSDGNLDMISAGLSSTDGYTTIRFGDGRGTFGAATSYFTDSGRSYGVVTGDFNGDGVLDLLTAGLTDASTGSVSSFASTTREGIAPILPFTLTTRADAMQSMAALDRTLSNLSRQRGVIGAYQSRLSIAINQVRSSADTFKAAESRIRDIDVASQVSEMVRMQILQQASASILAQANQSPRLALQLLQ